MSFRFLIPLLFLASLCSAVPVEVSHPVADFIRRLEEKGLIKPGFWSTLPRSESEVASALQEAKQKGSSLTAWDRRRLERYLNEFGPARKQATKLHYEDSAFSLLGHAEYFTGGYLRDSIPTVEGFGFGSFTPGVEGTYGQHAYFTGSATVSMERNRNGRFMQNYDPGQGLPYNTSRDDVDGHASRTVSTFDGFRAVVGFGDGHFSLEGGQDWNQWGPGHWQHPAFSAQPYFWVSDSLPASLPNSETGFKGTETSYTMARQGYRYPGEGPPLPQIRLRLGGSRWEYVKIVAQRMGLEKDSAAHLVAHRLQVRLGNWKLGGTEMLTIGTRSFDVLLLVPGIPLKFAEHSGGDRDNSAMGADVEWTWEKHGRLYAELFVDDFSGLPLNFWGDKFAWVLGASFQDPFQIPTEVHVEYAHVDPWVYGHQLYNTQMQNYGALLGSSLPPNSRAIFASASFPLPYGMEGLAEWRFRQHDSKSRGSWIFDDYFVQLPADNIKQFLVLDVETRNELDLSAKWSWDRYVELKGGAGTLWAQNWRGHPGESLFAPSVFGEVYLRY